MKLKLILCAAVALLGSLAIGPAAASIHTGSLDLDGGGLAVGGVGGWAGGNPTFSWSISNEADGGPGGNFVWLYAYNFNVAKPGAVSHFILETSIGTTAENFRRFANAILQQDGVKVWTSQQGNPNMPGGVNGIKLDPAESESLNWSFSFWADREPVWGDFYIKNGKSVNSAWNAGFLAPDPVLPAASYALNDSPSLKILRPDGAVVNPEPAAILVWGLLGLIAAGYALWRRKR